MRTERTEDAAMSMILGLTALGDDDVGKILAHPPLVLRVLAPDDPEVAGSAAQKGGFLSRLFGARKAAAEPALSDHGAAHTDLDKAWHGIHFLLTGTDWEGEGPLSFLVKGGTEVGDIDVGYGPARAFRAAEVRAIAAALAPVDEATLRARFDPAEMMKLEIYPEIWDRDPADDDTLGYCMEYYGELKQFVAGAAGRGEGLLVHLG
jgi:hypothetical protein